MRLFAVLLFAGTVLGADPRVIPIYEGPAPGSENWTQKEYEVLGPKDDIRRVHNVITPTLTVYLPEPSKATGTGIVVCPGGGFRILAIDHEGHEVARWLNSLGVAAFVLKYRVMQIPKDAPSPPPNPEARRAAIAISVADGVQAMRVVRAHAREFGVSTGRIGIMGFSAGGRVTLDVALNPDPSSRPDFAAPIYAAAGEEIKVPANAPPVFLVHATDDKTVPPLKHSVRIYAAWTEAGIPAEMHIYASGGHGFGMRKKNLPVDAWTDRLRDWLSAQGLLKP